MAHRITKQFTFDSAHFLPNVPEGHKCGRLHGHTYTVILGLEGDLDPRMGWIVDFGEIKTVWKPLEKRLDHFCLNDIEGLENPTAEVMALWIFEQLKPDLPQLADVVVKETANTSSRYRPESGSGVGAQPGRGAFIVRLQLQEPVVGLPRLRRLSAAFVESRQIAPGLPVIRGRLHDLQESPFRFHGASHIDQAQALTETGQHGGPTPSQGAETPQSRSQLLLMIEDPGLAESGFRIVGVARAAENCTGPRFRRYGRPGACGRRTTDARSDDRGAGEP